MNIYERLVKNGGVRTNKEGMEQAAGQTSNHSRPIIIFMVGDVMTGRGIDQALPHPSDPRLYEPYMKSAIGYVRLAEEANGAIQKPVEFPYIWGDALEEMGKWRPDVRIINLETAVTTSEDYWRGKDIHYRMHPENIRCLTAAQIDCCTLANNHVLDWGYPGLIETLETLKKANLKSIGAGRNIKEAEAPAVVEVTGKSRVFVFSFGAETSGIPRAWAASKDKPGVNLLKDLSDTPVPQIAEQVRKVKRVGDVVVASIHWGGNWGYEIPGEQIQFAHQLIDEAEVDVIHGHSSHHAKGIEVYQEKLILYGCGDFLDDYEGIGGYEEFRDDLVLMYFASMDSSAGKLVRLVMRPFQIKRFRLNRASAEDARWIGDTLNGECKKFGTRLELDEDNFLILRWK